MGNRAKYTDAFFGGLGFGWLAWRTRSVLYGTLLHAYIINLVIFAASG